MITNTQAAMLEYFNTDKGDFATARRVTGKIFDRVYGRGVRGMVWAKLTGKDNHLKSTPPRLVASGISSRSVHVPLEKIIGTEGRTHDFDANFNPLNEHNRDRWVNIAAARRTGVILPSVELVRVGDEYYVRDGHHRISVAKVMGQVEIDALIVN